jgi:hypothetical protein
MWEKKFNAFFFSHCEFHTAKVKIEEKVESFSTHDMQSKLINFKLENEMLCAYFSYWF